MTDSLVFILVAIICIKTLQYGVMTFSNKNITGGIFIFFLSLSCFFLGAYILLSGGA